MKHPLNMKIAVAVVFAAMSLGVVLGFTLSGSASGPTERCSTARVGQSGPSGTAETCGTNGGGYLDPQ
jgi:hypothetical protein